jgi:hypothetical protein
MLEPTPAGFHFSRSAGTKRPEEADKRRIQAVWGGALILSLIALAVLLLWRPSGGPSGADQALDQGAPAVVIEQPTSMLPEVESPVAAPQPLSYTVQEGDTLSQISQSFGVEVSEISRVNQIADPDFILPGQVLIIPQP